MLLKMNRHKLVLRPNCLITRRPLVVYSGAEDSHLRPQLMDLEFILKEHGYPLTHQTSLHELQSSKIQGVHIFTTEKSLPTVVQLAKSYLQHSTCTLFCDSTNKVQNSLFEETYCFHVQNLQTLWPPDWILNHVVQLAENDFIDHAE
jgi:hypothetical protein